MYHVYLEQFMPRISYIYANATHMPRFCPTTYLKHETLSPHVLHSDHSVSSYLLEECWSSCRNAFVNDSFLIEHYRSYTNKFICFAHTYHTATHMT